MRVMPINAIVRGRPSPAPGVCTDHFYSLTTYLGRVLEYYTITLPNLTTVTVEFRLRTCNTPSLVISPPILLPFSFSSPVFLFI